MAPTPRLSCARRFVLVAADGGTVADGVVFAGDNGPVVLHERGSGQLTTYEAGVLQLAPFVDHVEWIDAERPTPCVPRETGRPTRG